VVVLSRVEALRVQAFIPRQYSDGIDRLTRTRELDTFLKMIHEAVSLLPVCSL
jgi:hypothetical protein